MLKKLCFKFRFFLAPLFIAILDCVRDNGRGAQLCAPTDVYLTQLKTTIKGGWEDLIALLLKRNWGDLIAPLLKGGWGDRLAIALFSLAIILYLSSPAPSTQQNSTPQEIRGVWLTNIDSDVLFERNRLRQAIQTLHQLNFNTIYPTIWNWGYTLYPSQVAAKAIGRSLDPAPGLQGRDILQEIIQQGHQLTTAPQGHQLTTAPQGHQTRMAVIPWFEFGFMAPADSQLAQRHPQWLTRRRNNKEVWLEGKHKRVWLNPFHPEVQQFIQDLILEVVTNYNIDGIQFDDHFGLPSEFGYDPFTVKLYQQEHNGKKPPSDPQNPEWLRWRADKITAFLKQVFQAVKQQNPKCLISIAPNPQRVSYDLFLADWAQWDRQGLVEELVLQVYRNNLKVFMSELQYPEVQAARKHIPVGIGILSGLKGKYVPWGQIQNQVQMTRRSNFAGVSFFFYETLWNLAKEHPTKRQASFQKLFSVTVQRPNISLGWKPKERSM